NLNLLGFRTDIMVSYNLRNAEIYQCNVGVQHELTSTLLFEVAYSASRSTHLPFNNQNINFVSKADREKWGSSGLGELVDNPFQPFFKGPNAIFNEPDSIYNNDQIPRINLLHPFPQFDGGFQEGRVRFNANARYNSLQLRMELRAADRTRQSTGPRREQGCQCNLGWLASQRLCHLPVRESNPTELVQSPGRWLPAAKPQRKSAEQLQHS